MLRIKAADLPIASITMISFSLCIWGAITNDLEILTWSCLLIWAHNLLYGFRQIKRNIVFIAFHITFFLFLLSSLLSNIIYEGKVVVLPQNTYSVTTLLLLYTSLLVCYIGYRMLPNHRGKAASENNDDSTFVDTFRIICVIAFYFTVCFNIYCTLRTIQLADLHGYKAIYIKSVGVPSIIAALGKVNDDAFFCLCASMPTKKQFRLPSIVFLLEDAMYLRTGARADFVLAVCFVGIYYVLRNNETTERWIGHKEKILAAVILPVLIVSMVTIGETRIGNEYDYDRSTVAYEIMGQGGSVKVLYYQQIFKDEDCMQQGFTFGAIWKIFCQNIIAKKVFGMPNYGVQSVASAYHAHNYGDSLSYCVFPESYALGRGIGSSYIAELMQDYGWIGVILINLLYGVSMRLWENFGKRGLFQRIYLCFCLEKFLYTPRSAALAPFFSMFYLTSLISIASLFLLTKLYLALPGKKHSSRKVNTICIPAESKEESFF